MIRNFALSHSSSSEIQETTVQSPTLFWVKRHQLVAFFVIAFGITWGAWFLLIALQSGILPLRIASTSLAAILLNRFAGWGPAISALVLTALVSGKKGMREFFSRVALWRVGLRWYAAALFSVLVIVLIAVALYTLLVGPLPGSVLLTTWYSPILEFFPLVLLGVVMVGLPEEAGWRGYALPRLLSLYNPLAASLLLGLIWGLWHLPLYTIIAPYGLLGVLVFLLRTPALSILITWVYLHTKRSILISMLFHAAIDTATAIFFTGVAMGAPHFLMLSTLFTGSLWVAVIIVIVVFGPRLSRKSQIEQIG